MSSTLIKNATLVNEGQSFVADVLIKNGRIEKIAGFIGETATREIDATGLHLLPGVIDDQVHFREPGLTHKADIHSESRAAVAGGTTSFMEMPNTKPPALTQDLLQQKYDIAARTSAANYSFFMGTGLHNYDELMRTDLKTVCGIKIFMGSSTGDMLVDDEPLLDKIFANAPNLIATHCEDDKLVNENLAKYIAKYGENIPAHCHPEIRNEQVCLNSSSMAVDLAKKHGTRLHILHITTADELVLFRNDIPLKDKKITSEVCVHHLWFSADDYTRLGHLIKCNPAIKAAKHKEQLLLALLDDRLDIIATDHAPHTWDEKQNPYPKAYAGLPLVQHGLNMMLEFVREGKLSLEKVVEKMSHCPAVCFRIKERGYLREGYHADLVLVNLNKPNTVSKDNLLYKCGWSPLEGQAFTSSVEYTFVSGQLAYENGKVNETVRGERLEFEGI